MEYLSLCAVFELAKNWLIVCKKLSSWYIIDNKWMLRKTNVSFLIKNLEEDKEFIIKKEWHNNLFIKYVKQILQNLFPNE